jgi:hypothetical protein
MRKGTIEGTMELGFACGPLHVIGEIACRSRIRGVANGGLVQQHVGLPAARILPLALR